MANRGGRDLAVGAMFSLALLILALAIMAVGGESRLFTNKAHYLVVFPTADGLVVGSPVKMSGVIVGTVSAIRLSRNVDEPGIEVEVGVDQSYAGRVREDSRAALRILQILSGEKYVEIVPGTPESPELPRGAEIAVAQSQELFEQAAVTAENVNEITISLRNILHKLEGGEGLTGQMINDPEFGKDGLAALRGGFENLEAITGELRRGRGFVGRMLTDDEFADRIDDLSRGIVALADTLEAIDTDAGALGALLEDDGSGEQAVVAMRDAATGLQRIVTRLESNEGLIGRLLNDAEYSERVADDLQRTMGNLAEITDKINRGEGTLGALINQRALHDSLEDVATGVNDSKFARWLVRRYQKKGIKVEEGVQDESE